jgi:hypothetical protein
MWKKIIWFCAVALILTISTPSWSTVFTDDFNTPRNYITSTFPAGIWDGIEGTSATTPRINANISDVNGGGRLSLASANGYWSDATTPKGPFLYKVVSGDFVATVKVTDYAYTPDSPAPAQGVAYLHNDGGLMARASFSPDVAGTGEDWVSIDYFPIWTCGNFLWTNDDGVRTEWGNNGRYRRPLDTLWPEVKLCDPYLKLERYGNVFHFSTSPDGVTWTEMAQSPRTRADLAGLPVQVGLRQATYSANFAWAAFDDFTLETIVYPRASNPVPADKTTTTPTQLAWQAGCYAADVNGHDVYFGTSFADVNAATEGSHPGLLGYSYRQNATTYPVSGLIPETTYYWRIDEVNTSTPPYIWKGDIWSFTAQPTKAWAPDPYNDKYFVIRDVNGKVTLSWNKGFGANRSRIYFSTSSNPTTLKATINHTDALRYSWTTDVALNEDTVYYWKVNQLPPIGTPIVVGDIWHFKTTPNIPISDPNLVGWWKLEDCNGSGTVLDSSGYDHHGTIKGNPQWVPGYDGEALKFDGKDDYAELPIGSLINSLKNSTFALWVNSQPGGANARIFDFGKSWNTYMCLTARQYFMDPTYFAFNIGAGEVPTVPSTDFDLPTGWHHLAVTIDANAQTVILYYDGTELESVSTTLTPKDLGVTINNWLGRSHDDVNDSYYLGSMDDFRIYKYALSPEDIQKIMASKEASVPNPPDNATDVDKYPTLTWSAGSYAANVNGHKVYFDPCEATVQARNGCDVNGVFTTAPSYTPSSLEPLSPGTYFWAVDEVNPTIAPYIWPGPVWRFTVPIYSVLDNFERYASTGAPGTLTSLRATWLDGYIGVGYNGWQYPNPPDPIGSSGSYAQNSNDTADGNTITTNVTYSGGKSLKLYYDNDGSVAWLINLYGGQAWQYYPAPMYSEVSAAVDDNARIDDYSRGLYAEDQGSLGLQRDWTSYKMLKISYFGDSNNAKQAMYVGLSDGDGTIVTINNPDPNAVLKEFWNHWYIKLKDFNTANPNLDLTNIARIYLGFGNRNTPVTGGKGNVFFDAIQLTPVSTCSPANFVNNNAYDFTGDCQIDAGDLQRMTQVWLGEIPSPMPTPVIRLDASGLALGPLSSWTNTGSAGGTFLDFNTPQTGYRPTVVDVDGRRAVVFDGNDIMTCDINTPASITGTKPFTIVYTVRNPSFQGDEELFTWAKRGTTNRAGAVCFGDTTVYEAAAYWGVGDTAFDRYQPSTGKWHTIFHSYKGGTNGLYYILTDGMLNTSVTRSLNLWPDCYMLIGGACDGDPNLLPRNKMTPGYFYSGAIAKIEIYDVFVAPSYLNLKTGDSPEIINFKDIALFANKWLLSPPVMLGD